MLKTLLIIGGVLAVVHIVVHIVSRILVALDEAEQDDGEWY